MIIAGIVFGIIIGVGIPLIVILVKKKVLMKRAMGMIKKQKLKYKIDGKEIKFNLK